MAKNNFLARLFNGKSKDYYEDNTWNDLGHSFTGIEYSKTEGLKQYQLSLYVFRAVSIIADRTSSIPIELQRIKNTKGEIEVLNDHELYNLLYRPNPDFTWNKMMKLLVMHLELTGEGFWYKIRDSRGNVIELVPLLPQNVTKVVSRSTGKIVAIDLRVNNNTLRLDFNDVVYFNYPSPLSLHDGQATILAVRSRIETEKEASEYQAKFFENNAQPSAILKTDNKLTDDQKASVKKSWELAFGGSKNFGKTALLENGLDFKPLVMSQKEMDFIESMRFTREDILVAFGVPKGVLLSEDSNNADGQNAMRSFLENKVEPLINMIVETINIQLVEPDFGIDLQVIYENPVPDDRNAIVLEIEKLVDKVMTRNEARTRLGLEPIDGGDSLYNEFSKVPLEVSNTVVIDQKAFRRKGNLYSFLKVKEDLKNAVKSSSKQKKKKSYTSVFVGDQREVFKKMILKRMDRVENSFSHKISDFSKARRDIALDKIPQAFSKDNEHREIINEKEEIQAWELFLTPVMISFALELGQSAGDLISDSFVYVVSGEVTRDIERKAKLTAESIVNTTNAQLDRAIRQGIESGEGVNEISDRVAEVFSDFPTYRSDLIARTETTYLNGHSTVDAYKQNGVEAKEWIATHDSHTRPDHLALDGQIVGVRETFADGSFAPPKEDDPYNCRCAIAPAIQS